MNITIDNPQFVAACQNLAAFIWSNWSHYGYSTKAEFWEALPESTKVQIREFILDPKENPNRKMEKILA